MEKLNAKDFQWAVTTLRSLQLKADAAKATVPRKERISDKDAHGVQKMGAALIPQLEILEAQGSIGLAKLLLQANEKQKLTYSFLSERARAIDELLRTELSNTYVFALGSKAEYFEPTEPLFGAKFELQFPSLTDEIAEAGKCYALGRNTAAAFHLIRCLEGGILAVSLCLNIPPPTKGAERSWSKLLKAIKDEKDRRWPPSHLHTGDGQFFDGFYGKLSGMQNPYRNTTMHLETRYNQIEARGLFEIVKDIMVSLANRMDEKGLPLA